MATGMEPLIPLSDLNTGNHGVLEFMHAGRGLSSRLTSLGLTPGTNVTVLQNYGHGPLIVNVRGTHVALSRGVARHLMVKIEGQE
jgi:ferrous iron transport protein A